MSQKGLAPVLIVILSALVLGGFLIYQKQTKSTVLLQTTRPTSTPSAAEFSSSSETTRWKTGGYTMFSFSYKYPEKWDVVKKETKSCFQGYGPKRTNTAWMVVCFADSSNGNSPEKSANLAVQNSTIVAKKNMKIDNHNSIWQEVKKADGSYEIQVYIGDVLSYVNFPDNGRQELSTLPIVMYIQDVSQIGSVKLVFDQILSTFKFTQ